MFQSAEEEQFRSSNGSTRQKSSALTSHDSFQPIERTTPTESDGLSLSQPRINHLNTRTHSREFKQSKKQPSSRGLASAAQAHRQRPGRVPFEDVRQARQWFMNPNLKRVQAAILLDPTIPHGLGEKQLKRMAANKLRVAFETAQPARNDEEFHKLDTMCLELTEDVVLSYLFGELTARYTSGKSRFRSTAFDSFDEHIDTLAQVLGQVCPRVKSVRKRLTDVPYRKRLIDNPLGEVGLVEKNKDVNEQRRLKLEETKAKAARAGDLERELAELKSQMRAPSSARQILTPNTSDDLDDSQLVVSRPKLPARPFTTPGRSSSRLSVEQDFSESSVSSPYLGNQYSPATGPYQSTITNTHGPSAAKKPRYANPATMQQPLTPTPRRRQPITAGQSQQVSQFQARAARFAELNHHQHSAAAASNGNCTREQQRVTTISTKATEDAHDDTAVHQRQEALMKWFETGQITQEAYQENFAGLDQTNAPMAANLQAETISALAHSSKLSPQIAPRAGSLTAQDMPDFDGMMSDELPNIENMNSEEFSRFLGQ